MNAIQRTAAVLFLATGFLSTVHAQEGATGYFLYAPGGEESFPGSTQDSVFKPKKAAEVLSFSMGSETPIDIAAASGGGGAGKATSSGLEVQFSGDLAILPGLIQKSTTGSPFEQMVLEGVTNGLTTFKLELNGCFIQSVNLVGTEGDVAVFRALIPYGSMKMSTFRVKPDGTLETAKVVTWNYVLNKP